MLKKSNLVVLFFIAATISVGMLLRTFVVSLHLVEGPSMEPTLHGGDLVVLSKWSKNFAPGEIIVFNTDSAKAPQDSNSKTKMLIKRLIALPNSEVYVDNFKVFVNTVPYAESLTSPPSWNYSAFECRFSEITKLRAEQYFVMGDNRCFSADSRVLGGIPAAAVKGKVAYVVPIKNSVVLQWTQRTIEYFSNLKKLIR